MGINTCIGYIRMWLLLCVAAVTLVCDGGAVKPRVLISTGIRNKGHTLSLFFGFVEKQTYPKDRITWLIQSDHNIDDSVQLTNETFTRLAPQYEDVYFQHTTEAIGFKDETADYDMSPLRMQHLIEMKNAALAVGHTEKYDFLFLLDADVLLTEPTTLERLVEADRPIIAPLLNSTSAFSNFWAGMSESGYYERTPEYLPILERKKIGIFDVPMVNHAVMIKLKDERTKYLTYGADEDKYPDSPFDDIVHFAYAAQAAKCPVAIDNRQLYGFFPQPLEGPGSLEADIDIFEELKLRMIDYGVTLVHAIPQPPATDTLHADEVVLVNLARRPERLVRSAAMLRELGIKWRRVEAVDGQTLTDVEMQRRGVETLPDYRDPHHHRVLTKGEIGCFLSHYEIWQDIIARNLERVVVLEDDARLYSSTAARLRLAVNEADSIYGRSSWHFMYLGRKKLPDGDDVVSDTEHLIHAGYSYWTIGYIITKAGAERLLANNPIEKVIAVDEYIPLIGGVSPHKQWEEHFKHRTLHLLSIEPLVVYPLFFTNEEGYASDTEDSPLVDETLETPEEAEERRRRFRGHVENDNNSDKVLEGNLDDLSNVRPEDLIEGPPIDDIHTEL